MCLRNPHEVFFKLFFAIFFLQKSSFEFGDPAEDAETKETVKKILELVQSFPEQFDETKLFSGSQQQVHFFHCHYWNGSFESKVTIPLNPEFSMPLPYSECQKSERFDCASYEEVE